MTPTMHQTDEEADTGGYQAYLRAQSDSDLMDIVHHLDPARYPARLDAALREARRRHVLHLPVYTIAEYAVRYVSVLAFSLVAVTLMLASLLTENDALGPTWPSVESLPDGVPVSRVLLLMLLGTLRCAVILAVRLGLYPIACAALGWWVVSSAPRVLRHQARADVWRLAVIALLTLVLAMTISCGPDSAVPDIFSHDATRGLTLLDPFA